MKNDGAMRIVGGLFVACIVCYIPSAFGWPKGDWRFIPLGLAGFGMVGWLLVSGAKRLR
jgi:hypothetical protein